MSVPYVIHSGSPTGTEFCTVCQMSIPLGCRVQHEIQNRERHPVDFDVSGKLDDSVFLLRPVSARARAWTEEHGADKVTTLGDSDTGVTVERLELFNVVEAIRSAGMTLRWLDDPYGVQGIDYDVQTIRRSLG